MSTDYSTRPPAQEQADRGAVAWRAAVHAQQGADPHHGDFYTLAGHLADSLASARSLVRVLERQVERYPAGRDLYDDTGTVDPRERCELALLELEEAGVALDESIHYLNRFHCAIGHIGYYETGSTDDADGANNRAEPAEGGAR